ncbi:MAG: hypothetical protein G3M70_07340 [Candidatus Nitronauta litoralis]|uniref:Uncharacterized protein n=1 Tax=Candidatus Nitronauta litoralis TaxID=2705533 RepID=A0A7T0BVF7_9BACT|nr:MAG: hypothetical protein G3M70_07340 [Candidatus Nitronauta litoralis]
MESRFKRPWDKTWPRRMLLVVIFIPMVFWAFFKEMVLAISHALRQIKEAVLSLWKEEDLDDNQL